MKKALTMSRLFRDPAGTRTQGPIIKSDVLYQLSYEINLFAQTVYLNGVQKYSLMPFAPKNFSTYSYLIFTPTY